MLELSNSHEIGLPLYWARRADPMVLTRLGSCILLQLSQVAREAVEIPGGRLLKYMLKFVREHPVPGLEDGTCFWPSAPLFWRWF